MNIKKLLGGSLASIGSETKPLNPADINGPVTIFYPKAQTLDLDTIGREVSGKIKKVIGFNTTPNKHDNVSTIELLINPKSNRQKIIKKIESILTTCPPENIC